MALITSAFVLRCSGGLLKFCPAPDCGHAMDAHKASVDFEDSAGKTSQIITLTTVLTFALHFKV